MNQCTDTWNCWRETFVKILLERTFNHFRYAIEWHQNCQLHSKTIFPSKKLVQQRNLEDNWSLAPAAVVLQLKLGNDKLPKHLALKSSKKLTHGDLRNYQLELKGYIPENPCYLCRNIKATIISSIKVYDWLTSSEKSSLSRTVMLMPEWVFSIRSSEHERRVRFQCNGNLTDWCRAKIVFVNQLVFVWQAW